MRPTDLRYADLKKEHEMSFPKKLTTLAMLAGAASLAGVVGCSSSSVDHLAVWTTDVAVSCPGKSDTCYYEVIAGTSADNLSVAAVDSDNRLVTDYSGTWHFTSDDPDAVLPADYVTDPKVDFGMASFHMLLARVGDTTVTVDDGKGHKGTVKLVVDALEAAVAISFTEPDCADLEEQDCIDADGCTWDAGDSSCSADLFTADVTAEVQDQDGRDITNYTGTLHFTSVSSDNTVTPPSFADHTFTSDDSGAYTFPGVAFSTTPGPKFTITATDTADSTITGDAFIAFLDDGSFAPEARFVLTPASASVPADTAVEVTVTVVDPIDELYVKNGKHYRQNVEFTSSDPLSTLPSPYTFTETDADVHTFSVTFHRVGATTLTVTGADGTEGSVDITVTAP
jgi:hypothetical protein